MVLYYDVIYFDKPGNLNGHFFHKQHFYKQRQAEIGKKMKQMLSNTLRLNFCYLKIIHILHPRYHQKIISKRTCMSVFMRCTSNEKMKNRSYRYDINRHKSRHGHKDSIP